MHLFDLNEVRMVEPAQPLARHPRHALHDNTFPRLVVAHKVGASKPIVGMFQTQAPNQRVVDSATAMFDDPRVNVRVSLRLTKSYLCIRDRRWYAQAAQHQKVFDALAHQVLHVQPRPSLVRTGSTASESQRITLHCQPLDFVVGSLKDSRLITRCHMLHV